MDHDSTTTPCDHLTLLVDIKHAEILAHGDLQHFWSQTTALKPGDLDHSNEKETRGAAIARATRDSLTVISYELSAAAIDDCPEHPDHKVCGRYTRAQRVAGGSASMARDGQDANGNSNRAKSLGSKSMAIDGQDANGKSNRAKAVGRKRNPGTKVETALTKLPATVNEAHRLTSGERQRLNTMLRNAFFAEFGLSIKDVRGLGAAGIKATLDRVRRDDRWQSSAFCDIKPTGLGPL